MCKIIDYLKGIQVPFWPFLVFILSAIVSIWAAFIALDASVKIDLFTQYAYYVVGLSFIFFVYYTVRVGRLYLKDISWQRADVLVIALLSFIYLMLFSAERNEYKVVMDEVLLLSVSKNLAESASPQYPLFGYWMGENFILGQEVLDKRPILYPVIVSIVHTVFGFSRDNAFILNNVLSIALVLGVYSLMRKFAGILPALVGSLAFLSIPEFVITGNGAGMGMTNLLVIYCVLIAAAAYLENGSKLSLNALIFSGVMLSQVRPESIFLIFAVAAVILIKSVRCQSFPISWFAVLAPWTCAVYVFQNSVFELRPALWQDIGDGGVMSFDYLWANLSLNFKYFFNLGFTSSNFFVLSLLFVIAMVSTGVMLYRGKTKWKLSPTVWAIGIIGVVVLAQFILFHFYYAGSFYKLTRSRYTLPFCLFACLFIAYVLEVTNWRKQAVRWIALILVVSELLLSTYPAVLNEWRPKYAKVENWKHIFAEAHRDVRFIVIGEFDPWSWVIYNQSSVPIMDTLSNLRGLKYLLEIGYFDEVFYRYPGSREMTAGQVQAVEKLKSLIELEPYGPGLSPEGIPVMSRVTEIHVEPLFPLTDSRVRYDSPEIVESSILQKRILRSFPQWDVSRE